MALRTVDPMLSNSLFNGNTAPMVNPTFGGQFGHQPDYTTWISAGSFVRQHVIPVVLSLPRGVTQHPRASELIPIYKNLLEVQPRQIQGLQQTLNLETASNPFGGGGQNMEDPIDVKRDAPNLSMTFQEREGRSVMYSLEWWIQNLVMTPESKFPGDIYDAGGIRTTDRLPDYYSATMMFIEPDKTGSRVVDCYLMTNVYPKSAGPRESARDLAAAKEAPQLNIQFSGFLQPGYGSVLLAQQLLDEMLVTNANPNMRPAFLDGIEAQVRAGERGYANMIATEAATAVTP